MMFRTKNSWPIKLAALLLAVSLQGCNSSDSDNLEAGGGGAPGNEHCAEEFNGPLDPSALIDDLEDGDGLIAEVGGRNGSWWLTTDDSDGTIEPAPNMQTPPERILGGRCDSSYAIRVTGADYTDWGAVLSIGLRFDAAQLPVDLSDFKGISFWARTGEQHSSSMRIQFQDSTTHPEGGLCSEGSGGSDDCWDGWGTEIAPLGEDWQLYRIRFSSLAQRNYGLAGEAFDTENVYAIDFNIEPNSVFDFWVDDLWLYE